MQKGYTLIVGSLLVVIVGVVLLTAQNESKQPTGVETESVDLVDVTETTVSPNPESIDYVNISAEAGFENVYRLEGNFGAWIEAGHEIES